MKPKIVTWDEFKKTATEETMTASNEQFILYRGHADHTWKLQSSLSRFLNSYCPVTSTSYYNLVKQIEIANIDITLPNVNPISFGLLTKNEEEEKNLTETLLTYSNLRHQGLPSPILDWTEDYRVAAFFSLLGDAPKELCCIYLLKQKLIPNDLSYINFKKPSLEIVPHQFINKYSRILKRQKRQKSAFTIALTYKPTYFVLQPITPLWNNNSYYPFSLTKFVIKDSLNIRKKIIDELYEEGINYTWLFADVLTEENTILKDYAIKNIFLKNFE